MKRILLVDDDKHLVITLSDYLSFEGFEVTTAHSAEEALRKLSKTDPDLIILDIAMPGMGGTGFLKRMPVNEQGQSYPVLVLTARSAMEKFFDNIDVAGFLAKPCSEGVLLREISSILARREPRPTPAKRDGKRILLGEDNAKRAAEIAACLRSAGYRVEVATNGPTLLERATVLRPHVLLLKDDLPKIKGSALAPLLSAMPGLNKSPILLYDETREIGEDRHQRYRVPKGITKVVASDVPDVLLHAIDTTLGD